MPDKIKNADGSIVPIVAVQGSIADSAGGFLPDPASLPHVYGYDGSNNLVTDTVTDGTNTWVKTFTYTGTSLTGESAWVKQ